MITHFIQTNTKAEKYRAIFSD